MNIKEFKKYIQDNPQGYWFKARWYGWGWVPAKWQGWVTIMIFIMVLIFAGFYLDYRIPAGEDPAPKDMAIYFGILLISIIILLWICLKKGEKPRWSWGDPRKT